MKKNINILLVDDHALVRAGLKAIIEHEPDMCVTAEASTGEIALNIMRTKKTEKVDIDIVLMDIKMPGIGGFETTRRLLKAFPHLRIVILTSCTHDPYPVKFLQTGALGFLEKDCTSAELIDAIRCVSTGQRYLSAKIAQTLALMGTALVSADGHAQSISVLSTLSDREMQVLIMLGNGLKVAEIAKKLSVTPKTVNTYRYRLYAKLRVKTDVELAHIAIQQGLIDAA